MPSDVLTRAIRIVDLPALVAQLYPASGATAGTTGVCFASWRGNENTPAFSLFRHDDIWFWKDQATGESGNAFHFLTLCHGLERQEAAHFLLRRVNLKTTEKVDEPARSKRHAAEAIPIPTVIAKPHRKAPPVAIEALAGRGFNKTAVARYGILRDGKDALIPIMSPEGVVLAVKRRKGHLSDRRTPRYTYETKGHGSPAWCSPECLDSSTILITEGELNAIIANYAMAENIAPLATMGIAGADNHLNIDILKGKTVYIHADNDDAGAKAQQRWAQDAHNAGATTIKLIERQSTDFCDVAGKQGRAALAQLITELMANAETVYGPMDRLIAGYRVRDFVASAKRFISGEVVHSTAFADIDAYTGGIPESGIIIIGGVSSMGKSALLRRMLLEEVIRGGKIRLYSPDQSPQSVFRLLASAITGIPAQQVRERFFSDAVMKRYQQNGMSEKDTMKVVVDAWRDAYQWVVLDLSQRFQISEESELKVIKNDIEQALDEGVTMFGGDYLQLFEPEKYNGEKVEGKASDDFKKGVRKWRVPFLFAVQLAKYKFGEDRKNGMPVGSDISGSGSIYNNSEQVYLIYNDYIYARKYAGAKTKLMMDSSDVARIIVSKNKEGPSDDNFTVNWYADLVLFLDPTETPDAFARRVRKQ